MFGTSTIVPSGIGGAADWATGSTTLSRLAATSKRCLSHLPAPPATAAPTATLPPRMKNPRRSTAALRSVVPSRWCNRSAKPAPFSLRTSSTVFGAWSRSSSASNARIPASAPTSGGRMSSAWPVGRCTATTAPSTPNPPIPRTPIHGRRYANAPISNPSSPITINMPTRNAVLSFVPNWSTAKFFSQIGVRSMNSAPTASRGDCTLRKSPATKSPTPSASVAATRPAIAASAVVVQDRAPVRAAMVAVVTSSLRRPSSQRMHWVLRRGPIADIPSRIEETPWLPPPLLACSCSWKRVRQGERVIAGVERRRDRR